MESKGDTAVNMSVDPANLFFYQRLVQTTKYTNAADSILTVLKKDFCWLGLVRQLIQDFQFLVVFFLRDYFFF